MARKIRFSLNMPEKKNIRTIEELKQSFDLKSVLEYYYNGKLAEWLTDRGYDKYAEQVAALDDSNDDFEKKLCNIFDAEYVASVQEEVSAEDVEALVGRKEKVRQYTDDTDILDNSESVVFSQEELEALLQDDANQTIYLAGDEFVISGDYRDRTYIGLNNPMLKFLNWEETDWDSLGIKVRGARVADKVIITDDGKVTKTKPVIKKKSTSYQPSAALDFLLDDNKRKHSEKLVKCIAEELEEYIFDPDADSKKLQQMIRELEYYRFDPDTDSKKLQHMIQSSGLNGYFTNYLNRIV